MLFHLVGRACASNARGLKVFHHVDDMLDPLPMLRRRRTDSTAAIRVSRGNLPAVTFCFPRSNAVFGARGKLFVAADCRRKPGP
jgi:hypothetical protein